MSRSFISNVAYHTWNETGDMYCCNLICCIKPINSFIIISCGNKTLYIMITKIEHRYKKEMTSYRYLCWNQECKLYVIDKWAQCKLIPSPIECIVSGLLYKLVCHCSIHYVRLLKGTSAWCVHYVLMFSNADICAMIPVCTTERYCVVFQSSTVLQ